MDNNAGNQKTNKQQKLSKTKKIKRILLIKKKLEKKGSL